MRGFFYDPARKEENLGRTRTRLELREEHFKEPMGAVAKVMECLENPFQGWYLVHSLSLPSVVVAVACSIVGAKILQRCGKGSTGKASGLTWTHGMLWRCAQYLAPGMYQGSTGRMASSFSSSSRRSSLPLQRQWCLSLFFLRRHSDWSAPGGSRRCVWVLFAGAGRDSRTQWSKIRVWKDDDVSCSGK